MLKISEPKTRKIYRITKEIEGIKYLAVISYSERNDFLSCKLNFNKPYSLNDFKFLSKLDNAFTEIQCEHQAESKSKNLISEEEDFENLHGHEAFQCIADIKKVFRDLRKTETLNENSILETNTFKLIEDSIFNILEDLSEYKNDGLEDSN